MTTLSIVGAGNVASHLAREFHARGCRISTVAASHIDSARRLADKVGATAVEPSMTDTDVDFVIIAVSDSAVSDVAASLPTGRAIVAHTSGSVPLDTLKARHDKAGVFYPLQTFSRDVNVDISRVPIFTEASDAYTLEQLDKLAGTLSRHVYHADSERRKALHVAGVLTSNFPVYLLEIARQQLAHAGFPLEVVQPLAEATIVKAFQVGPHDAMTGPARRGDIAVTQCQAAMLPDGHREVYNAITNCILHDYHSEQD